MNDVNAYAAKMAKQIFRDPKKRSYVQKTFLEAADMATLQKYTNMYLTGKYVENGELRDLDDKGAVPEILERLERIEEMLKKLVSENETGGE